MQERLGVHRGIAPFLHGPFIAGVLPLDEEPAANPPDERMKPEQRLHNHMERGGQIVASIRSEPRSFNRLVSRDQNAEIISLLTQGRLVRINRATFDLEPWLAERWDTSADGRTFTLHLRQGVTWSDGTPFTSADVKFTYDLLVANEGLSGSGAIRSALPLLATIEAPDDLTVVMTFTEANTVEQMILDAVTGRGGARRSAIREDAAGYRESLGTEFRPPFWDYLPGPQLPRQPGDVMVESWVREALVRLNPEIAAQPVATTTARTPT